MYYDRRAGARRPRTLVADDATPAPDADWSMERIMATPTDPGYAWRAIMAMSCDRDQEHFTKGWSVVVDAPRMAARLRAMAEVVPPSIPDAINHFHALRKTLAAADELDNPVRGAWQRGMLDALHASPDPVVVHLTRLLDPRDQRQRVPSALVMSERDADTMALFATVAKRLHVPWD